MDAFGGDEMRLSELFTKCLTRRYEEAPGEVNYALESEGETLQIYFEASRGLADWKRNVSFPAKAYSGASGTWYAHYGFLHAWRAVRPLILARLRREPPRAIVLVGYSQGAAIATLCYGDLYDRRAVAPSSLFCYAFASPRVLWGRVDEERWRGLTVIRNLDDLVTHLPPSALGFRHVGRLLEIGERGRYGRLEAHTPEAMLRELVRAESVGSGLEIR